MKCKITKILSAALISLVFCNIPAQAKEYTEWKTNTIVYTNAFTVYADSSQWDNSYGRWMCSKPDFNSYYKNAWICTNGKWYYVGDNGFMKDSILVGDKYSKNTYFLDETGAMLTNGGYFYKNHMYSIDSNGIVNLPQSYYDEVSYCRY